MITPVARVTVSVVTLTATLALAACARGPSPVTFDGGAATSSEPFGVRFENEADRYVDVYLVGERREWWLGRVAPGARTTLRIPDAARAEAPEFVRLAVLVGEQRTLAAGRDSRATFTIPQPASNLLDQRWTFRQTPLTTPELIGAPTSSGRR